MNLSTPDKNNTQQRRAYIITLAFLIGILANLILSISLGIQTGAWQQFVRAVLVLAFGAATILTATWIRSGRTEEGIRLLISGILITLLGTALLLAGLGIVLAMIELVLVGVVATLTLSPAKRNQALLITLVVAILTYALNFVPLNYRVPAPEQLSTGLTIIAVLVLLGISGFIFWTSRESIATFMQHSIRNRLTVIVAATAILPVLIISFVLGLTTYTQVREETINITFDRLNAIEEIKTLQLSTYFTDRKGDTLSLSDTMGSILNETLAKMEALNTLKRNQILQLFETWSADVRDVASDPSVAAGFRDLATDFENQGAAQVISLYSGKPELENAGDESNYSLAHLEQHGFFVGYIDIHGYEDAYLIDLDGNVVYSVHKTDAFGTNLTSGTYKDSSLAALYRNLLSAEAGTSYIADVDLFEEKYTMFIGSPVYDGSTQIGVLAYQLPLDTIRTIMAERTGQGLTGESFLIAQDEDGNVSYRSDRTSLGNERFVIGYDITDIASPTMRKALAGESGGGLIAASTGETRINAYRPLDIEGFNWAVFTSVNAAEALSPTHIAGEKDYLSLYQETYGYYDIFLIHPKGVIFYTAIHEAEFGTNILTGPFNETNLAALVNRIIEEKAIEFEDFATYEPSGGTPAAFFGGPVLDSNGEIVLIVATQIAKEDINKIMNEEHGLGETGETYIIGSDLLGRMDSRFIGDFGVDTTVLNPDFAVDTEAVRSALAGESRQGTIIDYRGLPVLSVWKPFVVQEAHSLHLEEQVWAVMTEIDESEALQPVNQLAGGLGFIIASAAILIGALAVFLGTRFARGFVTPIIDLTDTATQVAAGNLDLRLATDSQDEVGTLTNTFNTMTAQLQETLGGLEERVAARTKDLATVATVSTTTSTIRDPEQMLSNMVRLTQRGFNLYHAHVFTYNKDTEELEIVACGYKEGGEHEGTHGTTVIPMGQEQSLVALAARTRRPVIVNDVRNEPGWLPNPQLPETRAELAVPMIVGDELLGVLDVQSEYLDAFTEEDANIQMTLAAQVATSLQNALRYSETQKRAELESLVNVIGQRIQRTTSIEDTLQTAIRELGTAIGAKRVRASIQSASRDTLAEPVVAIQTEQSQGNNLVIKPEDAPAE